MHLESTCIDMPAEKIQAILERSKPINYKWLISKIRKHLPELYSDLCSDFYNPYKNQCRVTKEYYILVHSAIEFFIRKL
nr:MAG TPA: hypothetical protein [Caudoviricetes sp.]